MKSGLTVRSDNAQSILNSLKALTRKDVLVGIPEDENARDEGSFGNAAIGYINENGSPAQNIPPRPHLKPGVQSVQPQTLTHLKNAAVSALEGNQESALRSLESAGTVAANGVKRYMTITGFTPLADATVSARQRRGRTGVKPLIDTGEYRRAITHVVRDKDADS
jgi:hypothetical protein